MNNNNQIERVTDEELDHLPGEPDYFSGRLASRVANNTGEKSMSHKPLIQHLSQIVDQAQNGADMDVTKRNIVKAIHHYKPMPNLVKSILHRANSAMSLSYISALLVEAQSLLICHDLDSQIINGTGGLLGSEITNTLTTVAVGDILSTEIRTCSPDLLKKVEAMTRYDIFDVYEPSSEIDEVDDGKYLKREDVIRLLGGDA